MVLLMGLLVSFIFFGSPSINEKCKPILSRRFASALSTFSLKCELQWQVEHETVQVKTNDAAFWWGGNSTGQTVTSTERFNVWRSKS